MLFHYIMVAFLALLILVTAVDPVMAAKKKRGKKGDAEVQKALAPITEDLTPLTNKALARGFMSPEETATLLEVKLKLLDLIKEHPSSEALVKPTYEAARIFRAREMYDDAFDFYNFIRVNFPGNPYAAQSETAIQRMKEELGQDYFARASSSPVTEPDTKPVGAH